MALGIALSVIMLTQAAAADVNTDRTALTAVSQASQTTTQVDIRTDIQNAIGQDDPATLISLGVAFARSGQTDAALQVLNAAVQSETRYRLETASGEWVDSRRLALKVIGMIDNGQFAAQERIASR